MTLETIIRTEARFVSVMGGTLRDSVIEAARALVPDLAPHERKPLMTPTKRREFDPEHLDRYDPKGNLIARWRRPGIHGDKGQSLAEYALLLALIAVVAIVAVVFLGSQISSFFQHVGDSI